MKRVLALLATGLTLAACTASLPPNQRSPLAEWKPSPNHNVRRPSLIVLHYTVEDTLEGSRRILSDPARKARVSAHYLLDRDGRLLQLVPDHLAAWHAGAGRWGSVRDLNQASIGIEIVNTGNEPFPEAQITVLIQLLHDLVARHGIDPRDIIAHADLAPGRKIDPGHHFPWQRLYQEGFGIWPAADSPPAPEGFDGWQALQRLGYSLENPQAALHVFRLRFRGMDDGNRNYPPKPDAPAAQMDAEDLRILHALTR